MRNEYDEEAPDRKESLQEAKSIETMTVAAGMIEDDAGAIRAHNATTTSSFGGELEGLPEGLPGQGAKKELPEELRETFYPTRRRSASRTIFKPKSTEPNVHRKFPQDCYSFIAMNGPKKNGMWASRERLTFFVFGLLPFIFQMVLLVLLAYSQTNELRGTIGETDNPDQGKQNIIGLFAKFIPANSTPIIRVAQVTSLAAYVIFPSSSLQDVVRAVQLFPYFTKRDSDHPISCLRLSCLLRATQGIAAMVVTVLLVLTSVTVVDIILNFTAVNFISGLDEDAFFLAMTGEFSPALKIEADRIAATDLPPCMFKKDELRWKCYKLMTSLVYLFLFAMVVLLFAAQNSKSVWATKLLRVQFQDSTGLNEYSGCFEIDNDSGSIEFSRRVYRSNGTGPFSTTFAYCRQDRQWILFKGNTTDPCDAPDEEGLLLARSSKTDTFDISSMFEESWVSASNTPLDLYFFGGNETIIRENCGLTLGDGDCDPAFNELGYDFDGGDCCAATCTKSNCGRGGLTSVFGNTEVSGDGYETCVDPSMVPITIYLNSMTSSRDPQFTGWKQLSDVLPSYEQNYWDYDENQFIEWMNAEPLNTYLSLDCNGKNAMTAYLDNSMINLSQTVMVEDGSKCSLVVRNATSNLGIIESDPIWYIDYTIFHDNVVSVNSTNRVEIFSGHSSEVEAVRFTRIPECYFEKLHNHIEIESIYTGNSSSIQAIDWLLGDLDPKQQCEDPNFVERYALVATDFATASATNQFIARDEQCRWPSITCNEGKVVSIQLAEEGLQGNIPTELGLISDLQTLRLDKNQLTSLPTEIGNLSSLQRLVLELNQLTSLPTVIGNLSSLQELNLFRNKLMSLPTEIGNLSSLRRLGLGEVDVPCVYNFATNTQFCFYSGDNQLASLPTEIGNLSSLEFLDLNKNLLTSLPTQIGNLSSLQELVLPENQLASLPTEIGNLSNLLKLFLYGNKLTSLPTEIFNLSSLQRLPLFDNQLTSVPTEIGNLSSLQELSLWENLLTSVPTEIGNLSSLWYLELNDNQLTLLPTEIGNLSSLVYLYLTANLFESLPSEIGRLSNLMFLQYDANVEVPEEINLLCSNITCTDGEDTASPTLLTSTVSPSEIIEEGEEDSGNHTFDFNDIAF